MSFLFFLFFLASPVLKAETVCHYSYASFEFASPEAKVEKRLGYLPEVKHLGAARGPAEDVSAVDKSGKVIGHILYRVVGHLGKLKYVNTRIEDRQKGISELLFARMLEKHPEIKKVDAEFAEENSVEFYKARKAGMSCEDAVKNTPAFKMTARFGFTTLVDYGCGTDGEAPGMVVGR